MNQAVSMGKLKKQRLDITIRPDLVEWLDKKINQGDYASRSHAIEKAIITLREKIGE